MRSGVAQVQISPSVLNWALARSGRDKVIRRKLPKLSEWLAGKSNPTLRDLEKLAKITSTPLGYLFLPAPPKEELPIPYLRTFDYEPRHQLSPELIETVYMMKRRQEWMRQYLIEEGHEPLPFVHSADITDKPGEVAQAIKRTLRLGDEWAAKQPTWTAALSELRDKIEGAGILVVVNSVVGNNNYRKLDPNEFRGLVLVDPYAPLVFVNGADGKAAQMFTLAHELAHVWLGASAAFDLRELQPASGRIELACDRIAAEFLVPKSELQKVWPSASREPEPFAAIARHFKVSELVAARRALDLGLVTKREFIDFYTEYQARERPSQDEGGGNFYVIQRLRVGRRFAEAVIRAVREGRLLYRDAYELTGLYGKAFDKYAQSLGLGGE
ncbi:MAG: ImmA/IrrE family metallo-endopeptidase [Candidatus Fermentithermobacillus carboniphilus]|uniref:ImmA/IrrE family metallo-endopeptidase n=1 Tax=Candidatus Fermentithermobacillus carboniphilus TaxID=3085328 RepID=A0AAT9LHF8_9FIRM|nr:MAG: ImmA/IrrE family metallo-endopeptidase [Candidatus Fermentithermobacillus carboniphilus]